MSRTWWSARYLAVLEAAGVGGRLARGRTYARQGPDGSLQVDAGAAAAKVQGSAARPYRVRIGMPTLGKARWGAVFDALAADASLTAAMLAGELPREVEDIFAAAQGLALFPAEPVDLFPRLHLPGHPPFSASTSRPCSTCCAERFQRRALRCAGPARALTARRCSNELSARRLRREPP